MSCVAARRRYCRRVATHRDRLAIAHVHAAARRAATRTWELAGDRGEGWRLSLVLGARHRYGAPRANGEDHPKAVRDLATQRCLNEPNEFNRRRLTAARRAAGASPSRAAPVWILDEGQSGFWTRTSWRFSREAYATRQVTARSGYRWCADCSACDNVIHREVTRFDSLIARTNNRGRDSVPNTAPHATWCLLR